MADSMVFPNDWAKFLEDYSFRDHKEFYTNGARLIPTFRVEQMMHHYLRKAVADFVTENNFGHRWIPVTEGLPKEDEDVIAFCYYHESWQAQVCHLSSNYEGEWYTSVAGQWVRVTHWMPLPKPPKEVTP